MPIRSLLIANRGEIAVRIIMAARQMGIHTVQVYSAADAQSLAVRLADEVVEIGPPAAAKSYRNIGALIAAGLKAGCDGVHPGYGFLAESGEFAEAVENAGMVFVGPTPDSIRRLGDKVAARQIARSAGVPTVPGSDGRVNDLDEALTLIKEIGLPVMIKAAAGGGGRGIRILTSADGVEAQLRDARAEASAAFGDGGLYIEKLVDRARHIEVQILGDGENVIHCFERECSLQRRRQKLWEEAPAIALPPEVRAALTAGAVAIGKAVGYRGAGTIEYLYDEVSGAFYFIEANTRIQVEHPVTEMITGIDLVQEMLAIAGGRALSIRQADVTVHGHAIECRINAEDPSLDFRPCPGVVEGLSVPEAKHIRFDTLLYDGYGVPPFYDSLVGKLIVHGADRTEALARLRCALSELRIGGIKTTIAMHQGLAADPEVVAGRYHTKFLEEWLARAALQLADVEGGSL